MLSCVLRDKASRYWILLFGRVPVKLNNHSLSSSSSPPTLIRGGRKVKMAAGKVAHATLKGPSVVKEIVIGITLGLAAGTVWKMHHWNEQRKVRTFYDLLQKGEISVVAEE
ncbi:hypothetical protein MLD38_021681 [Melastoma candidum]|uniref:Uncharacterized protein n=1 Tax=Melastoma candidum TaxID=119954 RepID=A0ACB9QG24_9MYRT|nr:hypothetical protein MLD38_021681 [Melastoma candidum]